MSDVPPTWQPGAAVALDGLRVSLSAPVPVYRTRGYCWFPSLFRFGGGLAALMSAYGDIHVSSSAVYVSRSKDGGLTWTQPVVTVDGGFDGVLQPNGDLLMLPYYLRPRPEGMGAPYNVISAETGLLRYVPDGVTVSGWPRPDRSFAPELGTSGFVFNGQTVDIDGGYLMTLYGYFEGAERLGLVCATSPDGVQWQVRSVIADEHCDFPGGDGPSEAALIRQADGRILCVFRLGSFVPYAQCWSSDDGRTWTTPVQMDGPFSVQPSLEALPDGLLALSGGRPGLFLWMNLAGDGLAWQSIDLMAHHNACCPGESMTVDQTTAYTEVRAIDANTLLIMYDRIPSGWAPIPDGTDEQNSVWVVRAAIERD